MTEKEKTIQAIRSLREHMGLSQADFAWKVFKKKIASQQRYEKHQPPRGILLVMLVKVAREQMREDLADIFKSAAINEVPVEVRQLIQEPGIHKVRKQAGS